MNKDPPSNLMQNLDFVGPHNYQELTGEVAEQKRAELQMKNSEFSTKNQILTVIFSISFILLLFTFIWHITAALQPGEIEIFDNIGGLYIILILILLFCGLGLDWDDDEDEKLLEKDNSNIACRVCNKSIESKSTIERIAKGTAGIGGGTYLGMIVGTIILPGFGTLIGGALGAIQGSELGSQVNDICDNCCMFCEKEKINCTCNDIIGSCGSCGRNITRFNSRLAYGCNGCYDHGEDI